MRAKPLSLLTLGLVVVWILLAAGGSLAHDGILRFQLLYFAAALLYLAAAVVLRRSGKGGDDRERERGIAWAILAAALVFRLVLLATTPSLSSDVYRYVWEGQVQASGVNPYVTAPLEVDPAQRDPVFLQVNHPEVPGVYGPLMQLCFAVLAFLPGTLGAFKLFFLLADAGLALLVWRGLERRGLSPGWVLLYAWHPLVILEVAGQAHMEVVPIALMVLALELELAGKPRGAALALGCAIASKYLPVLLVPAFLLNVRGGRARVERAGLIALPVVVCFLPYLLAGGGPSGGLTSYGLKWRFNDGGFLVLDWVLEASGISAAFCRNLLPLFVSVDPGFDPASHQDWMRIPPKLVVGAILIGVLGRISWPRGGEEGDGPRVDVERVAFWAGALFLLLSPTVHPWYALWIVPFLATRGAAQAGYAGWLYVSLALPAAYVILQLYSGLPGSWREEPWVRVAVYVPCAVLLLAAWIRIRLPKGDADRL